MPVETLAIESNRPSYVQTIPLDGVQYRLQFDFSAQRASWYLTLSQIDGTVLFRRKRLTPGSDLTRTVIANGPPGVLTCVGEDPYDRDELLVIYIPEADLVKVQPTDFKVLISDV